MKLSEYFARESGAQAALAKAMGIKAPMLSQWATGVRVPPLDRCVPIERATGGVVTRKDLRPDDWQEIWPELAGVTTETAAAGG